LRDSGIEELKTCGDLGIEGLRNLGFQGFQN
jgi:hypothetical protein